MKYMTHKHTLPALLAMSVLPLLTSCFKAEPLNAECDIEQAYIHAGDELESWFANAADTLVSVQSDQTQIAFNMKGAADLTKQAPLFRLTPGATIQPESGSTQDFSQGPVTYTVTSEDRQWTRTYQVSIKTDYPAIGQETSLDFEDAYLSRGYYNWRETLGGTTVDLWATGNAGYKISNSSTRAENYPTTVEENGYEGKAVKLTTRRTSMLADMVKKPIAAGNLFIGQFDATDALRDAMKATKFGKAFSFSSKPVRLEGWYKYQPGDTFTDKDMTPSTGRTTPPSTPCSTTTTMPGATPCCSMATTCRPARRSWHSPSWATPRTPTARPPSAPPPSGSTSASSSTTTSTARPSTPPS